MRWITIGIMALLTMGTTGAIVFRAVLELSNQPQASNRAKTGQNTDKDKAISAQERCLVTVLGNLYDVTELAGSHSGPRGLATGGGFFKCGRDMSEEYVGEHGNNLKRLEPYLLNDKDGRRAE